MSLPVHNGGQLSPLGKCIQGSTLAQQDCQTLTQNDSCPTADETDPFTEGDVAFSISYDSEIMSGLSFRRLLPNYDSEFVNRYRRLLNSK